MMCNVYDDISGVSSFHMDNIRTILKTAQTFHVCDSQAYRALLTDVDGGCLTNLDDTLKLALWDVV
jgi:hypothetical protein